MSPELERGLSLSETALPESSVRSWLKTVGSAVNLLLCLLRPRLDRPSLPPEMSWPTLLDPKPSNSENVCVTSPSLSTHSDPDSDDWSSKKSAPGSSPFSIVSIMAGYTDPLLAGGGSMIRGNDAGLEDSLADGWFRNMVWVASGVEGSAV